LPNVTNNGSNSLGIVLIHFATLLYECRDLVALQILN
jgi:hypothetical protein